MRRVKNILVAVAMVTGLVMAATASPAHADVYLVDKVCTDGPQIIRCVELHWDNGSNPKRLRAHAGIIDRPGLTDYSVDVISVWVDDGPSTPDTDGWWNEGDTGVSNYGYLSDCRTDWLTYAAEVRWKNVNTGALDSDMIVGWVRCSTLPGF